MTGALQPISILRERKEALDKWADFLERCANGQHYNVIQGQFTKVS